jgi:hypothetical protein
MLSMVQTPVVSLSFPSAIKRRKTTQKQTIGSHLHSVAMQQSTAVAVRRFAEGTLDGSRRMTVKSASAGGWRLVAGCALLIAAQAARAQQDLTLAHARTVAGL